MRVTSGAIAEITGSGGAVRCPDLRAAASVLWRSILFISQVKEELCHFPYFPEYRVWIDHAQTLPALKVFG